MYEVVKSAGTASVIRTTKEIDINVNKQLQRIEKMRYTASRHIEQYNLLVEELQQIVTETHIDISVPKKLRILQEEENVATPSG